MIVIPLRLLLLNGSISTVFIPKQEKDKCCQRFIMKKDCCIIMQFLDVCQIPGRSWFWLLTTIKYMMAVFKAVNSHSKYALQILYFLAHQQESYSQHTANKSLKIKKQVKNIGSNKIIGTFSKQARALASMSNVAKQYDQLLETRNLKKDDDYQRPEHPFKTVFHKFEKTFAATDGYLSQQDNKAWIQHHTFILDHETGK
ncbi:hypothetical protein ACJMK2_044396 [Sinanodonta woodiana]|uniref:Uncharacterized protein n=1 Tax=Sinanodonta woodiana TaxID=1069815 RepID=A0ABD3W008_SINWO